MNYDPRAIANEFLDLADSEYQTINPMKLQKLVYYAYGWCLALTGKPLFEENVEAWKYGPVVPSIYYEFKEFGNSPITARSTTKSNGEAIQINPKTDENADFIHALIKKVWDVYKIYSAIQLSNATHQTGTPWEKTVSEYGGMIHKSCCIDDDLIKKYFLDQAKNAE